MSRPKKTRRYFVNNRTPKGVLFDHAASIARALKTPLGVEPEAPEAPTKAELAERHREIRIGALKRLRIDPMGKHEELSLFMAPVLVRIDGEDDLVRNECREWLANVIASKTADDAETMFKGIAELKRELEIDPHKNFSAFLAYHHFIESTRREPSRRELKKFILENPKQYRGMPQTKDSEGWDRLWNDCGLAGLKKQSHETPV